MTAESRKTSPVSFLLQLWHETLKLLARPRTHLGFAAFLGFEILILFLLQLPRARAAYQELLEQNGYLFAEYFSGLSMAVLMMMASVFFLGSLFLALVAGDIVAKEVEDGTLRMILNRSISRGRLLAIKAVAVIAYTFGLVAFITVTSLLAGLLYQGWGGMFVYAPMQGVFGVFSGGEGLLRLAGAAFCLSLCLSVISAIGFLFSCLPMKPAAATILTLTLLFADFVLYSLPYFADYRHLFLSGHIGVWIYWFDDPIPFAVMGQSLAWLGAVAVSCFWIGIWFFQGRDFKS